MGFNLRVILHLVGLLLNLSLLAYFMVNTQYYATILTLVLLAILQTFALLRYISFTNRQLARFLLAVGHADFAQSFRNTGINASFKELGDAFDGLIERFRDERSDKEAQAAYLHAFVEQIPIAVLALHEDGRILLSNQAFRRLIKRSDVSQLKQVSDYNKPLADCLTQLKPGIESSLELKGEDSLTLTLSCSLLRSQGEQHKLVSIQNIQQALEAKEMEAWQNLIRVMTHEIMNSITPITSLASTANQYIEETKDADKEEVPALLDDVGSALQTISKRSQGLTRFVESYRTLTRLPMPQFKQIKVNELLHSVTQLMNEQIKDAGVTVETTCSPITLELNADPELLEQALINLMRNSLEALTDTDKPVIQLKAILREKRKVEIQVIDNGTGIEAENIGNIFIPFFTTKRGGSGIGMSIVKQIVNLNKGQIKISSVPKKETTLTLFF